MRNKLEEIKMKIKNKDAFWLGILGFIYNKPPIEINKEVSNLAYTTIFSYSDILISHEIIQDIKRLKFKNEDMNEISRSELLKDICTLSASYHRQPMEFAIEIWSDSEKYSNGLKIDMMKRLEILELSIRGL